MAKAQKNGEVTFTNLGKEFYPSNGFTKGDVVKYYIDVSQYILPHLKQRPVTLIRFPDGVKGERFYEKNAPRFAPAWLTTFRVPRRRSEGEINYVLINDARSLAWCANLAALELHPFLHRVPKLDQPTCVAFDFDPGEGADILTCIEAVHRLKEILDPLGLVGYPKVTGSKGIQVYIPLNTACTYAATGAFAKAAAELLEQRHPDLIVSKMTKVLRRGKVLIDWSQNSAAKTTVSVYSLRGKHDEPFVSMPVEWKTMASALKKGDREALFFSPAEVLKRLKRTGDLFAPVLKQKQTLPREFRRVAEPKNQLTAYAAKRDFKKTKEPPAEVPVKGSGTAQGAHFVIQKHAASHLHYDFRLEMDGTLKSWAVPKGVPTELGVKRAAFAVEDHPLNYMKFEGTIPKGQYGGGTVMVWDIGTYEVLEGSYSSGSLKLVLSGKKLKGEWHLFHIKSDEDKPVWLIVKGGKAVRAISKRSDDTSALSGRSMDQIAASGKTWR